MTLKWINNALAALPGTDDALFHKVWNGQRLLFDGKQGIGDGVDYQSARLVAAALKSSGRLAMILPDFQPHRPAFLFATAMIRHFLDTRRSTGSPMLRSGPVLYFGSTIGIRDQLRRTSVLGLDMNLAEVFSQRDVSRGAANLDRSGASGHEAPKSLPRVITVYAPADPIEVIRAYDPSWIAIDCGDASSLIWLRPLLDETAQQGIPIIAWGQNPLSYCVNDMASNCQTFTWPPTIQSRGCLSHELSGEPDVLMYSSDTACLAPFVLYGKSIDFICAALRDASQILGRTTQQVDLRGRFEKDALLVHWRYLRSLESLAVPIDFYDAEAQRYWGLQSFSKLTAVCEQFRSACKQSDLYSNLEEVAVLLNNARTEIETHGCALWESLANLCIEDPASDEARILVFSSDSKKRLFLFAMLARYNITEDDLREIHVYVVSLNDLRRWMHSSHNLLDAGTTTYDSSLIPPLNTVWHPVIVGLPSPSMTPRLLHTLLYPNVDIVLYPHQCSSFMRRQAEWSVALGGDTTRNAETLAFMTEAVVPPNTPASNVRILVKEPMEINVETIKKTKTTLTGTVWQPEDPVVEVARLLQSDNEDEDEELAVRDQPDDGCSTPEPSQEIWCEEAIKLHFDQGWRAYFAPDDAINVIVNGKIDQRYVRSLRGDERILIIHGQQRQSLYDLIISRVHRHPSIELHLAMIRRWQEDIRVAYARWCIRPEEPDEIRAHGARNIDGLLIRMQGKGSQLKSSLTLAFWLRGSVLCPLEPEDLRRIGEVLDMGFVQQHYKRISKAASRLRGLHRGLANRLNRWLQDQVTGAMRGNEDDVIDAELGLTFGDVRNSLMVLRIKSIENLTGPFLRSTLGRVEKDT
jgi:hypothetical protein